MFAFQLFIAVVLAQLARGAILAAAMILMERRNERTHYAAKGPVLDFMTRTFYLY
jgi:hypothetical protein